MDLHFLDKKLGVPVNGQVLLDLPDSKYHKELEGFSSSALKEYYKDPEYAFAERVRGLADRKPHGREQQKNFRIGRAVHCAVLEGEAPFQQRYPIYGGEAKKGKQWEDFKTANPEAIAEDNVLTKAEAKEVMEVASKAKPQFDSLFVGRRIVAAIPEVSFLMTYSSGIQLKVRCDLLYIEEVNGLLYFRILDLKTCSFHPSNGALASVMTAKFDYELSGVMYYKVVRDCLAIPAIRQQLNIQAPIQPEGTFELFWVGKESKTTALQYLMPTDPNVTDVSWEALGVAKLMAALNGYQQMTFRLQQEMAHFKNKYEDIQVRRVLGIAGAPLIKEKWVLKDLQHHLVDENPMSNLLPSEQEVQRQVSAVFGRELKPEKKKVVPPTPKKEAPATKPKWGFNVPGNLQAVLVDETQSPPPTHEAVDTQAPGEPFNNEPGFNLSGEMLKKYTRKAQFKSFMKESYPRAHDKINWAMGLKDIKNLVKRKEN